MPLIVKMSILSDNLHWTEVYQEKADSIPHSLYFQVVSAGTHTDGPFPIQ